MVMYCYTELILPLVEEYINAEKLRQQIQAKLDSFSGLPATAATNEVTGKYGENLAYIGHALTFFKKNTSGVPWLSSYEHEIPDDVIKKAEKIRKGQLPPICAITELLNDNNEVGTAYKKLCHDNTGIAV